MQVTGRVDERFARFMDGFAPFADKTTFAVALSGGADSTALCLTAKKYADKNGLNVLALIVDHRLRPASTQEARNAAAQCRNIGVPCEILTIENPPRARIEETARKLRYELLFDACKRRKCFYLLTGHHAQDQAETFLMRQNRKSAARGLAGIGACDSFDFGLLLRPLLDCFPAELKAYNTENGLSWAQDETNESDAFERSRLRKSLTKTQISNALQAVRLYAGERAQSEDEETDFLARHAFFDASGVVFLNKAAAQSGLRAAWLGDLLRFAGQKPYAPSPESLQNLTDRLRRADFRGASLGGCFISPCGQDRLYVCREAASMPEIHYENARVLRYEQFTFALSAAFTGEIRPLGEAKLPEKVDSRLPKRCFRSLPAFFDKQGLFLVPHLRYKRESVACETAFTPLRSAGRDFRWTFNKAVKSE